MRIELGRKGDYAVRATLSIARWQHAGRRKAREVAAEMDIPARYLPQILAELVRAGLLRATAGPDGGYTLARPAAETSLLEVVEAAEGPLRTDVCVLRGGPCDWDAVCPLHVIWSDAERALRDRLEAATFADLASLDEDIEQQRYAVPVEPHRVPNTRRGIRDHAATAPSPTPATPPARRSTSRTRKGPRP